MFKIIFFITNISINNIITFKYYLKYLFYLSELKLELLLFIIILLLFILFNWFLFKLNSIILCWKNFFFNLGTQFFKISNKLEGIKKESV